MGAGITYQCSKCQRKKEGDAERAPVCCGQPMEPIAPLPICGVSQTAEHSRLEDDGEPCDDGRAGLR
jgi:hypothetical protein